MKKLFSLLCLCLLTWCVQAQNYQAISVYVVAHPDDWQLFMSPNAYGDLTDTQGKIVFIYLTSGDGGNKKNNDPSHPLAPIPYYLAREQAAVASSRFVTNQAGNQASGQVTQPVMSTTHFDSNYHPGGRDITTYRYRNTVHFFLRTSDSVGTTTNTGQGFADYHDTAIQRLGSEGKHLVTIDNSTYYTSIDDIADQIAIIMTAEQSDTSQGAIYQYKFLNHPEFFTRDANRPDHMDHLYAGFIAYLAASSLDWDEYAFRGYDTGQLDANLAFYHNWSGDHIPDKEFNDFKNEVGLYAIVSYSLMESGYGPNWDNQPGHKDYLGRNYISHVTDHSRPAAQTTQTDPPVTQAGEMALYPVPTTRELHVRLPQEAAGPSQLSLLDYRMRTVQKMESAGGEYTVNINNLPVGVYFVEVKTAQKTFRRKLVKASE